VTAPSTDSASASPNGALGRFYLPAAAIAALLVLLPSLLYPFARDQAVFAYVGSIIARGGMPYRDAWDLKPPGIYALYGLMAAVAPDQHYGLMFLVRLVDLFAALTTAVLLAGLARHWGFPEAGVAVAAWYATLYFRGGFWSMAQTEAFANPLVVGGAIALLTAAEGKSRRSWTLGLLAGALTGAALVLKFTSAAPVVVPIAYLVWRQRRESLGGLLGFAAGGILTGGAAVLWLKTGGVLGAYLDVQRGFVVPYTRLNNTIVANHRLNPLTGLWYWFLGAWPAIIAAALAVLLPREERRKALFLTAALAAAIAAVIVQSKYFLYHWETTHPWLALLAGWGTLAALRKTSLSRRSLLGALVALPLVWTLIGRWGLYRDSARYAVGALPRDRWLARFRSPDRDFSFLADTQVADYVRKHSKAGDPVLVWGFEPAVYLLSDRRPPTRFFFNVPVAVQFSPEAWKREFLADLNRKPPEMLLVVRNDAIPWATGLSQDSETQLQTWPELRAVLDQRYSFETQIEDFAIYRRHPG
jgi:hypothetical protein